MSTGLALLLRALLMVFGSLVLMLVISLRLAVIVLIVLPIAGLLIWGIMGLARPLFTIHQPTTPCPCRSFPWSKRRWHRRCW